MGRRIDKKRMNKIITRGKKLIGIKNKFKEERSKENKLKENEDNVFNPFLSKVLRKVVLRNQAEGNKGMN